MNWLKRKIRARLGFDELTKDHREIGMTLNAMRREILAKIEELKK